MNEQSGSPAPLDKIDQARWRLGDLSEIIQQLCKLQLSSDEHTLEAGHVIRLMEQIDEAVEAIEMAQIELRRPA